MHFLASHSSILSTLRAVTVCWDGQGNLCEEIKWQLSAAWFVLGGSGIKMKLQAQAFAWTAAAPFWMQIQTLFLFFFFSLQETPRLIFVRRKLFASGRNCVCVWLSQKSSQIPASTTLLSDWHYVMSAFGIFLYFDQKTPNCIQVLIFMEGPHAKVITHCEAHNFFGADYPDKFCRYFLLGMKIPSHNFFLFCPLGDTNVSLLGASSSHQLVTKPGTPLFLRERRVLVPRGLKGRKEGGDFAGVQGWGGTWQWNSVGGFMCVSWSWAQGPCCRSRNGECLIFSYFSIIPTALPQSFPILRG